MTGPRISRREIDDEDAAATVATEDEETEEEDSAELEESELDKARLSTAFRKESAEPEESDGASESAVTADAFRESTETAGALSKESTTGGPSELERATSAELDELDKISTDELDRLEELPTQMLELTGRASDELETTDESAAFVSSSNSANRSRTCEDAAADIKKRHRQKTRNRMGKIYKIRKDKRRAVSYFTFDMLCSRIPPYSTGETWW